MWLVERNTFQEVTNVHEAQGIGRMSPDPLRAGGVWGRDYLVLVYSVLKLSGGYGFVRDNYYPLTSNHSKGILTIRMQIRRIQARFIVLQSWSLTL